MSEITGTSETTGDPERSGLGDGREHQGYGGQSPAIEQGRASMQGREGQS